MHNPLSRRQFVGSATLALAGLGWGATALPGLEPWKRPGPARLALSLAAYSFRDYFQDASHDREKPIPAGERINLYQFIDYCAEHGCAGAELTGYYFPPDVTDEELRKIKRHAFLRGVAISGTAIGNTFTHPEGADRDKELAHVKTWIHRASVLGAPHIRVFAGEKPAGLSLAQAKEHCLRSLEECAAEAGRHGIFLGLENHGGIVAEAADLLDIMERIRSPWVGINLDTGNFHTTDPYGDVARCVSYAVNVQLKVQIQARGKAQEDADLPRLVEILRKAHYQGYVVLEYEAAEDPWKAVPRHLETLRKLLS